MLSFSRYYETVLQKLVLTYARVSAMKGGLISNERGSDYFASSLIFAVIGLTFSVLSI